MTDWLDGFDRLPFPHEGGSYVDGDAPWRLILHTTEGGGGVDGQAAYMGRTGGYPHFIVDPFSKRRVQLVSIARSVTTTKNKPGGVETNRLHAVQVEIVWFAGRIHELARQQLEWLGSEVVAPICEARPIELVAPEFYGPDAGWTLASARARQRMAPDAWARFNGVCGHQHVPENDHWDPGALDIDTVLTAARAALAPAASDDEGLDMPPDQLKAYIAEVMLELLDNDVYGAKLQQRVRAGVAEAFVTPPDTPAARRVQNRVRELVTEALDARDK